MTTSLHEYYHRRGELITVHNPIDKTNMYWLNNDFTKSNFPDINFQADQKKKTFPYILEKGKGVLDIGAHIGDFGVPLAIALRNIKRNDIKVICIDPSGDKCKFIQQVCTLNNLNNGNIKIINSGISNLTGKYSNEKSKQLWKNNTGGWQWLPDEVNGTFFTTLDHCWKNNIIGEIGFLWLDAQWMEYEILDGAQEFLRHCKPYILMEYSIPTKNKDGLVIAENKNTDFNTLSNDNKFTELFNKINIHIAPEKDQIFEDILLIVD